MAVLSITRISTNAAGQQLNAGANSNVFSPDGQNYMFLSGATNAVAGDTNGVPDLFLKNLNNGIVTLVSSDSNGGQLNGQSAFGDFLDGFRVVFPSTANNAVPGDVNGAQDIFLKNLLTNAVTLVSADAAGVIGNATSAMADPSLGPVSAGNLVVFQSAATNLVAGDVNALQDVFVKNVVTGAIQLASTATGGAQANAASDTGRISPNGNLVVFQSAATNLVAGDTNALTDVFVKNLTTGVTTRVSTSDTGAEANGASSGAAFSPDGVRVLFQSAATNLVSGDTNGQIDLFVKNILTGAIERVSVAPDGSQLTTGTTIGVFSPDATRITFSSAATNLVAGDTNGFTDVFVRTLATGVTERISVTPTGVQGNGNSQFGQFSANGNLLAFESTANNFVAGDTNGLTDVFLVSVGAAPPPPPSGLNDKDGLAPRADIFDAIGTNILRYLSPTLQALPGTVTTPTGQILPNPLLEQRNAVLAMAPYDSGVANTQDAIDRIVDMADATTAVAVMNYQFFTGRVPLEAGLDFLVNSAGNGADLNDGYYGAMSIENRFINFAVNLGKLGAGAAAFNTGYGALALDAATSKAYAEIFGVTPSAAKVAAILTPARQAYLTSLGGDAIGTKAAMVGYLLAEAAKSDLGAYAVMNENFLYDLTDGVAAFGADAHIYLGAGPRSVSLVGLG